MRKVLMAMGGALPLLLICGCFGNPASTTVLAKTEPEKHVAIPVEVLEPKRGPISEFFETTSRVEAERRVQVTSEAVGKCTSVTVQEGDHVKNGQVLAELDKAEISAQIRSASAQLQKLKTDYDRAKELFNEGLTAKAEYDNAKYAYEQQAASINQLQVQLKNTTIFSPINGVVTKKNIQPGQLVSSGSPAFDVVDPDSYILAINPPEKLLARLQLGQVARVAIDSAQGEEFDAKVRRINPSVDPQTGTVKVTLDFDQKMMAKLRESAFARVRLVMETKPDALLIPKDAVVEENSRKYLFVAENAAPVKSPDLKKDPPPAAKDAPLVANRIEIQTGLEDKDMIEILSGVKDGAKIVTVGQQTLKTGSEVKITNADSELVAKVGVPASDALRAAEQERQSSTAAAGQQ